MVILFKSKAEYIVATQKIFWKDLASLSSFISYYMDNGNVWVHKNRTLPIIGEITEPEFLCIIDELKILDNEMYSASEEQPSEIIWKADL